MVFFMEVSTSLNIMCGIKDYKEGILRASKCGFKYFDFNPCDYGRGETFYTSNDWRNNIKEIKEYADSLGVTFFQSHGEMTDMRNKENDAIIKKSIEAAAIAGVKWTVLHPVTDKISDKDKSERLEENIKLLSPFVEYAKSLDLGIAVENMPKKMYWYGEEVCASGFYNAEELIVLCDELNNRFGNVGICWDTGHANLSTDNQYDELIKIGNRLKVLHVADNYGQSDEHMPPFYGNVDFKKIVAALKKINYEGTFNFETHKFTANIPEELIDTAVTYLYKIGEYYCKES